MQQITIQEAQFHIAQVLGNVLKGEEIILTDHNKPVIKMLPIEEQQATPRFGSAAGKIWMAEDFNDTPEDFADYI